MNSLTSYTYRGLHKPWLCTINYLIFLGYLPCIIVTWVAKSYGALYGSLTYDAALTFLSQIYVAIAISSTIQLAKVLLFYWGIVTCFSETDLAHFWAVTPVQAARGHSLNNFIDEILNFS